ncbi:MAG: DUF3658 domain-containing protein [Rhodanobacteraceae bacterium]
MMTDELAPEGNLTPEQQRRADVLSEEQIQLIDGALLGNCLSHWRKVTFVIAAAVESIGNEFPGIPDVFYSLRVRELASSGLLQSFGDLEYMRYSEVRLPSGSK